MSLPKNHSTSLESAAAEPESQNQPSPDSSSPASSSAQADSEASDHSSPQASSSIVRWISLSLSSLVLMSVLGLVGYLWASDRQRKPPLLQVTTTDIRQNSGQFYVPFEVSNRGGKTAEAVQVVAKLQVNGVTVETGEQVFEFLSSREQVNGAFIFTQNPEQGELVIRVASYQRP